MIIDEKSMQPPPPPYYSSHGLSPLSIGGSSRPTLSTLPSHILLQIVYSTIPQSNYLDQAKQERQRKVLYWLATALRLVNRPFYIACMNVLRSTYLPAYSSLIRPPYSSDPFPLLSPHSPPPPPTSPYSATQPYSPAPSPLHTIQRETAILDRFISLKVREDVWADDSELHLERDESFKDIFDLSQPKSRLEDLVRTYGVRENLISLSPPPSRSSSSLASRSSSRPRPHHRQSSSSNSLPSPSPSQPQPTSFLASLFSSRSKPPAPPQPQPQPPRHSPSPKPNLKPAPLPFALLTVSFSPRKVGLLLSTPGGSGRRTIVETHRDREERLEAAAKRLVRELRVYLSEGV